MISSSIEVPETQFSIDNQKEQPSQKTTVTSSPDGVALETDHIALSPCPVKCCMLSCPFQISSPTTVPSKLMTQWAKHQRSAHPLEGTRFLSNASKQPSCLWAEHLSICEKCDQNGTCFNKHNKASHVRTHTHQTVTGILLQWKVPLAKKNSPTDMRDHSKDSGCTTASLPQPVSAPKSPWQVLSYCWNLKSALDSTRDYLQAV